MSAFEGVKVFSATKARERDALGDRITAWLRDKPREIVDVAVRLTSDREFHCLTFVIFFREGR